MREVTIIMAMRFSNFGISRELQDILKQHGIIEPTPVQVESIPVLLKGKDIICQAQTGTGKTLSFMLPIFEKIDTSKPDVQALIITPTRELAIQITAEAKKLSEGKDVSILAAYGGQDVEKQVRKLKHGIHLVIGTPGRLLDHLRRQTISFSHLSMLVLDEADQMLHMGFLNEVEDIINQMPKQKRQTMLFSATMPKQIKSLSAKYMKSPVEVHVQGEKITLDEIEQLVVETTDRGKQDALCEIINEYRPFMAIIFCRTKRRVTKLNEALQELGYNSDELHGDLSQAKRESVMKSFRKLELQFLVATDVAARGLDIEGMTHVFNYDLPEDPQSYIHRIGRTGRAGQKGVAVTFVTPKDRENLLMIEKAIRMTIKKQKTAKEKSQPKGKHMENDSYSRSRDPRNQKERRYSKPKGSSGDRRKQSSTGKTFGRKSRNNRGK